MGPSSCAIVGFGSVIVIPTMMIAGMNPQCSAVFATGATFCHAVLSASTAPAKCAGTDGAIEVYDNVLNLSLPGAQLAALTAVKRRRTTLSIFLARTERSETTTLASH